MRAGRATLVVAVLVAVLAPSLAQQYLGDFEGAVEFETYEDAPAWEGQLPPIGEALQYALSCFPKKADFFELYPSGTFTYRPAPDAFSKTLQDKDVLSYHGLVPPSVAEADPDRYDCDNIDQDGGFCRTELVLVKVYIQPVNDAPVAASGESFLTFMKPEDVVERNTLEDTDQWRALQPPYALVRELVGSDVDGDKLTYTITEQPENGWVEIVEDNVFKYTPLPFFSGQDFFEYEVDDSKGGYPPPNVPALTDRAKVIVQVGGVAGPPKPIGSNFHMQEDGVLVGPFARGAYTGGLVDLLRYQINERPAYGRIALLCNGMEVFDPVTCAITPEAAGGNGTGSDLDGSLVTERRAYFQYTPSADYNGQDTFTFSILLDNLPVEDQTVEPAAVNLAIAAVNDPPVMSSRVVDAPMAYSAGAPARRLAANETYGVIEVSIVDVDSAQLWVWLWRDPNVANGTYPEGAKVYHSLGPDGMPRNEIQIPRLRGELKVRAPNGYLELYYVAPGGVRGKPLDVIQAQATDTVMTSSIVQFSVEVQCALGWRRGTATNPALAGTCVLCPPGHVSQVLDSTGCVACPAGTFAPRGAAECSFCPAGTYQPADGQIACRGCGKAATSQPGSVKVTDCQCTEGHFGPPGGDCSACPHPGVANANTLEGADTRELSWTYCNEKGLEFPLPQWGFWIDARDPAEVVVRECSPHSACLGIDSPDQITRVVDGQTCAEGYEGERCSICSEGFYRNFMACHECRAHVHMVWRLIILVCICIVPILIKLTRFSHHFAAIDIVFMYTQVMGVFGMFYVNWPTVMARFLHTASAFNLNIDLLQIDCHYEWDFKKKFIAIMLIPVCMLVAMVIAMLLQTLGVMFQRVVGRRLRDRFPSLAYSRLGRAIVGRHFKTSAVIGGRSLYDLRRKTRVIVRSFLTFLHEAYIFLCLGVFSMVDCVESYADGKHYLEAEPEVECWVFDSSSPWGEMFPWALTAFFVYPVGIFVAFAWSLHWAKDKLQAARTHDYLGFMLTQFKADAYYYELVVLARMFCLALATALNLDGSPGGAVRQVVIAGAVLVVAQVVKMTMKPYVFLRLNNMERLSLLSCFLILGAGITFVSPKVTDEFRATATTWCVVIATGTYCLFGLMLFYEFMPSRFRRRLIPGAKSSEALGKAPKRKGKSARQLGSGASFAAKSGALVGRLRGTSFGPSSPGASSASATTPSPRLKATNGVTYGDLDIPEGVNDLFLATEAYIIDDTPATVRDAKALSSLYKHLAREMETIEEIRALEERVTMDTYIKPSCQQSLLMAMTKSSLAENIEAMEFIEEVMGETPLRTRIKRHRSAQNMIRRGSMGGGKDTEGEDYNAHAAGAAGPRLATIESRDDDTFSQLSGVSGQSQLPGIESVPAGSDVHNNPMHLEGGLARQPSVGGSVNISETDNDAGGQSLKKYQFEIAGSDTGASHRSGADLDNPKLMEFELDVHSTHSGSSSNPGGYEDSRGNTYQPVPAPLDGDSGDSGDESDGVDYLAGGGGRTATTGPTAMGGRTSRMTTALSTSLIHPPGCKQTMCVLQ